MATSMGDGIESRRSRLPRFNLADDDNVEGNGGSGGHSGWQRTKLATVAGGGGLTIQQKNDFVDLSMYFI
jgi:hypothetical protein